MRKIEFASLVALAVTRAACGNSSLTGALPGSIKGNWTARLSNPDGSVALQFSATFTQQSGSQLSITNLSFTNDSPCPALAVLHEASGSFTTTGSSRGMLAGTFGISEILANVGGPELTLQGRVSNSSISGTWSVNGLVPLCSGNGTFTIKPGTSE
jgi:hypothetical protein